MKLNYASLRQPENWPGYHLPAFDPEAVARRTKAQPRWLHFGAGNIFRIFPAVLCQRLIEAGESDTGVICCESYDDEIITRCYRPYDNLSIAVTLCPDGSMEKEVVGSISESLTLLEDSARVKEIFEAPLCRWSPSPSSKRATPCAAPTANCPQQWPPTWRTAQRDAGI